MASPDVVRLDYDDNVIDVVEKLNVALKKHDLEFKDDELPHDGFNLLELVATAAAPLGGDASRPPCTLDNCGHMRQLDAIVDLLGMPRGTRSVLDELRARARAPRTRTPTDMPTARVDPLAEVDDEFTRYFRGLGCTVTWDFKRSTGARWYEIDDDDELMVQVDFGTPLAAFLEDLPFFAEGKDGTSASEYEARGPVENFRALYKRVLDGRKPNPEVRT